jgi:hypothetical protein
VKGEASQIIEPISRPEQKDDSFLSRAERVRTIKDTFGFYPQSSTEMSQATALIGREGQPYPVLSYLSEIYQHQRKAGADAPRAVRSLVRSFDEYAGNAVNEAQYMELLHDQLSVQDVNNRTGFRTLFPIEDWQYDATEIATFSVVSRHLETSHFAETGTDDRLGKHRIDLTAGNERIDRIRENLDVLRIADLKRLAVSIQANQENRLEFWIEQLEASKRHLFARDVAEVALAELQRIR